MSRIIFETQSKSAEVSGSERFHFAHLTSRITSVLLDLEQNTDLILNALPADHYLKHSHNLSRSDLIRQMQTSLEVDSLNMEVNGRKINSWHLVLNSASNIGGDALKLAVRIHAQCEIHGYVNGENRAWTAGIIEEGLGDVFRTGMGWESVIELLRESSNEPVIMSYSITDNFREMGYSDWLSSRLKELDVELEEEDEEGNSYAYLLEEEWYELDDKTRWDLALECLKSESAGRLLEINPEAWPVLMGEGLTASKLLQKLKESQNSLVA